MKFRTARAATALAFCGAIWLAAAAAASAREFVQDQAGMFSVSTVAQLNAQISSFNAATGKEIVVMTVPSLGGAALQSAAENAFSQQSVNGILIFVARDDRRDIIVPDRSGAQAGWFTPDVLRDIRTSMEAQFRSEDYDAGITGAVSAILNIYRAHRGNLNRTQSGEAGAAAPAAQRTSRLRHTSMFWWVILAIVGFLILRSVLRAASGARYYRGAPPGAPGPGPPGTPPGPGYGPPPGYGYGGYGGGGGSFWSGLLGGLGGAWLGNELFRGGGGGGILPGGSGQSTPDAGGSWGGNDSAGWQSDAGQADMGAASGGDWSGGGFGDSGGGGDFGGGGGDSGGGW
ncbi:MAG: TPM domain-containing protein [Candidatus Cybelea sp.]